MNWSAFRPSKAAIHCSVLLFISFLVMTFRLTHFVGNVRRFFYYMVAPSYEVPFHMMQNAKGFSRRIAELAFAHYENAILKNKVQNSLMLESELVETLNENKKLRALLEFSKASPQEWMSAEVIGLDPHNAFQTFFVNRGTQDGVVPDSPVLALTGNPMEPSTLGSALVGRILECGAQSSKALLISDPLSSVAVVVQRSGEQGLLQGQKAFRVTLEYLNQTADVQLGDTIVTSGLGGIFPPGLMVGSVSEVLNANSGFRRAVVKPSVSLGELKFLLILKPNPKKLTVLSIENAEVEK